jgi:2-polyprenyl-6-hydroxyphenyl methylase/3-demethylubiquinone-9 3-methyltransferase
MDAVALGFDDDLFDAVACVQNGICAFGVDPETLMREALRVTRAGGMVLLSSYSDRFWPHRFAWFEAQAAAGLIGPVDRTASRDGVIVCDDGFRAGRLSPGDMRALCLRLGVEGAIEEVDGASVFCEIVKPRSP